LCLALAVAALETGALTQYTSIYDNNSFTKAGHPYTNCMSWHGYINVTQALAVSCNYFFCETAWRLGNSRDGTRIEGINILNAYMKYFGFNNKTGVEIGEYYNRFDAYGDGFMKISSPAYKEFAEKERNPSVPRYEYDWFDGDMSRTSIGQGYNNYTPAMMAKYFLIIANRGVRYPLHLVNTVVAESGEVIKRYEAVPEPTGLVISERTWDIVIEGMRQVTERGTGANAFRDFPVKVAGKTGTAQQVSNRSDHYSFGCFAPCDDPRIAVYVCIPFGDTKSVVSPSAQVARDVVGEYMGLNISPEYPEATRVLTR